MIVKPRIRGFICTTAHPLGCAESVDAQVRTVQGQAPLAGRSKRVLVLGCSAGYGLASRISAAFGAGAETLGVSFEKAPSEGKRPARATTATAPLSGPRSARVFGPKRWRGTRSLTP